jgi:hypothetical protein
VQHVHHDEHDRRYQLEARYHYIPGASDPANGGVKSSTRFIPVSFGLVF